MKANTLCKISVILLFLTPAFGYSQDYQKTVDTIFEEALSNGEVYGNLEYLCKEVGNRLSGSPGAAAAVEYTRALMIDYGFDTVYLQPVMVPNWKRGQKEILTINQSSIGSFSLKSLALGNSVGTGALGLSAQVIEASGMEELEKLGKQVEGKIVFLNGKMNAANYRTFKAYGNAVVQRAYGASEAAKYGAKAVIVRSITQANDDTPHTGSLRYKPNITRIPAVAISTNDADLLSSLLSKSTLSVYLETHCEMKADILSHNVIGQINGSDGDKYIAAGGHLDSWDVGEGAHDDGSGCMQGIEALRLLKEIGYQPKNNLRAVMWMNEENGGAGGRGYADAALKLKEKHLAALESDRGGFLPIGFTSSGVEEQQAIFKSFATYFKKWGLHDFEQSGGGADIGPLAQQETFLVGLLPDGQRYFRYHHTPADVFETVDRRELEMGAAAMASMMMLIDQTGLN
ncbi:MAG: carboxypeptidase Q [Cyclobacteriaceae bacterium]|jgi:carboxypeptidase Q